MAQTTQFPDVACKRTATIASGQTVSEQIDLQGTSLLGVIAPASPGFTSLGFQVAIDPADTPVTLNNGFGSAYTVTIAGGQATPLDPTVFAGWRVVRLVAPGAVSGDQAFTLSSRPV